MRLSEEQVRGIREELLKLDPEGAIYLFGSRTNDARRGGDVDLYFKTTRRLGLNEKLLAEVNLVEFLGLDVDLLVRGPDEGIEDDPIQDIALSTGIRL